MAFDFSVFLNDHRHQIIDTWVKKLHTEVGRQYAKRPVEELYGTISAAVNANFHVLVHDNYDLINAFIDRITDMRLKAGFLLSDVQKAFELYRIIVIDLLAVDARQAEFHISIKKLNHCLAYTMHRFSDHFQDMHQQKILRQNKKLEHMVKKRTAALEESERKYKTLVEEINDGYVVIQNSRIVFANKAFCRMHGYRLEQVMGKEFISFVKADDHAVLKDIYNGSKKDKLTTRVFEYKRLKRSGESFPTEIQGKTTRYDDKLSSIGICRDITERIKMEKKIRETERMAYIGQITASLSHEIRNPLSAVKMNLQILSQNKDIEGNDKRRVDISVTEVIRLEKILNQLLDFAKPIQMTLNDFDIRDILNSYIELLEMKFKEKNLDVVTEFDKDIPPVLVDGEKLGQAIINLLINAIESSEPSGQIRVRYTAHCRDSTNFVRISIEDEGQGLAEINNEDLFRPFFTTKTKGVGLGLANVKRIIDAHKGLVLAEKKDPQGARFSIVIPAKGR